MISPRAPSVGEATPRRRAGADLVARLSRRHPVDVDAEVEHVSARVAVGGDEVLDERAGVVAAHEAVVPPVLLRRSRRVAAVHLELPVERLLGWIPEPHAADQHLRAGAAGVVERVGQQTQSVRAAGAVVDDARPGRRRTAHRGCAHGGADDGDRTLGAGLEGAVTGQLAEGVATEHGDQSREARPEPIHLLVERDLHHLEVEGQGTRRDPDRDPTREPGGEPGDLLGHQRQRPEGQEHRARRAPPGAHRLEQPARHLQRVGGVPGEASVVLARQHAVEAHVGGQRGLGPKLLHDACGVEPVVRVEPHRHGVRAHRAGG